MSADPVVGGMITIVVWVGSTSVFIGWLFLAHLVKKRVRRYKGW